MTNKEKSRIIGMFKPIINKYKTMTLIDKRIIWTFVGLCFIILLANLTIQAYFEYSDQNINKEQCIQLGIDTANKVMNMPTWERILFEYKNLIHAIIFVVGFSWILHGVQLRLLA